MTTTAAQRAAVWAETRAAVAAAPPPPPTVVVAHDAAALAALAAAAPTGVTHVAVVAADTLAVALALHRRGVRPLVLNMADDRWPGGDVAAGSGAQEESLFRRTALSATLLPGQPLYPVPRGAVLLSRAVPVLRDTEAAGYAWLPAPAPALDFVSAPGVHFGELDGAPAELAPAQAAELAARVESVLLAAARVGAAAVVLGALGCGAWRCPPAAVAAVFRAVLARHAGVVRHAVFAVLTPPPGAYIVRSRSGAAPTANLDAFRAAFGGAGAETLRRGAG
jgi:uncharacterized protein (TIGR02452 family)